MENKLDKFKELRDKDKKDYCYPCYKTNNDLIEKKILAVENRYGSQKDFILRICPKCKTENG